MTLTHVSTMPQTTSETICGPPLSQPAPVVAVSMPLLTISLTGSMRNLRGHGFFWACGGRGRGATRARRNFDGAPRRRSTRRGPGGRGGLLEALRGCPPSARPPRPASAARQPNVNLGATRARTRPATRRAPLRPVWRHGRRWRGERRPSWCYRFAARAQSNMQIARTKPTSVGVRRGASPGSARRDLSAGTVGLPLPSCTSALAPPPPTPSPRPPAGGRATGSTPTTTQVLPHN